MIKQLAMFLLLLTAPAFSQGVGGGGVPGAPVAALPTATAAGQVPVSTGPGTAYTAQTLATGQVILPGTPNLVYSFVATGDQAGNTIHDISGSGNSVTTTYNVSPWTGTGWTMSNASNSGVNVVLPSAVATDYSYCATAYIPYYTNPAGNANPVSALTSTTYGGNFGWNWNVQYGGTSFPSTFGAFSRVNTYSGSVQPEESGFHTKCWVEGRSANSTSDQFYQDGVNDTAYNGAGSGDTAIGQWILAAQTTAQSTPIWYYFAAWPTQLTAAQVQQASLSMTQAVAARGVQVQPATTPIQAVKLLAVGDSITCCGGASTTTWWPSLLSVSSIYGTPVNEGIGGFPVIALADQAKWRDTPSCYTGNQKTMVILFAGTNDGYFNNYSAAATFGFIQDYVNTLTAAGCQVGVATMLSRVALDTFKDALNPLVRAGAANGGYFLADTASQPTGADGAYANTTYFNTDQVHPTNAGQTLNAAAISNAINAYGVGAASQGNPTIYSSNAVTMVSADRFTTIVPTAAATATLPDCLGVTGTRYSIFNASAGANTITFSGKASEAISGSATLAQNLNAVFQATLISQAAAGCGWQRVQ